MDWGEEDSALLERRKPTPVDFFNRKKVPRRLSARTARKKGGTTLGATRKKKKKKHPLAEKKKKTGVHAGAAKLTCLIKSRGGWGCTADGETGGVEKRREARASVFRKKKEKEFPALADLTGMKGLDLHSPRAEERGTLMPERKRMNVAPISSRGKKREMI